MKVEIKTSKGPKEIELPEGYIKVEKGLTKEGDLFLNPHDLEYGEIKFTRHAEGYKIESYKSVLFIRKEDKQ